MVEDANIKLFCKLLFCWRHGCQGSGKAWNWVTNMWEVGHPFPFSHCTYMNCERRFTRRWSCALYLQNLRDLAARRLLLLTWGVSGSNCDRSGLVWPRCSEVWCCFVWLSRQVGGGSNGQCQLQFVSPPPTNPVGLQLLFGNHMFAEHWCWSVGVYSLQHFT